MLIKTRGIVFRSVKYSETSIIADIYTEEKGLRKYIFSGVRSAKSKVAPSLLQVMSLVELVAYDREDRELNRVKEIRPALVYTGIPFDVRKGAVGLFMVEVARKTIKEAQENQSLFEFLFQAFAFLDETRLPVPHIHLYFLLELSPFLGFVPGGEASAQTPFFDLKEGVFSPSVPNHVHYLDEQNSLLLHQLLYSNFEICHTLGFNRDERRNLLMHLLDYYKLHIENFPEIHAHKVLQEVL